MVAETAVRTDSEHMELLRRLIAARGIKQYGLYLLTSENRYTPTGFEEMSGYAIDPAGGAHFFWVGWDDARQQEDFTVWQDAEQQANWSSDQEFVEATLAAKGLTIADLANASRPITLTSIDSAHPVESGAIDGTAGEVSCGVVDPAGERTGGTTTSEPAGAADAASILHKHGARGVGRY